MKYVPTNKSTDSKSITKVYSQIAAKLYNDAGIHLNFVNAINQLNNNFENLREELNQNFQTVTNGVNQLIKFSTQTNFIHHINNIKHCNNLTRNQSAQHLQYLEILKENQGDGRFNWIGWVLLIMQFMVKSPRFSTYPTAHFFYNDNFGIAEGDVLSNKRTKFHEWITCHQPIQLLLPYTEEPQSQQPQPQQPLQKPAAN
ncbi:hypothetical protein ACTFIY_008391 [Dictyostelium cf. discoideum]